MEKFSPAGSPRTRPQRDAAVAGAEPTTTFRHKQWGLSRTSQREIQRVWQPIENHDNAARLAPVGSVKRPVLQLRRIMAVSNTERRVKIRAHNNSAGVTCGTTNNSNQHQNDDSAENNNNNNKRKKPRRDKVLHVEFGFVKSLLLKYSLLERFWASPRNVVGEQPPAPTTE